MGITTWLDRITDETNLWLSAVKADEGKDLERAAVLYLQDASVKLGEGSIVRSALSCYCAADCVSRAGGEAGVLYFEAGTLYEETAELKLSTSIRESLWAMQRAYTCFTLAGDIKEAEKMRQEFTALSKRANPFVNDNGEFRLQEVFPSTRAARYESDAVKDARVREAIGKFLALRRKTSARVGARNSLMVGSQRESFDQESIVSQLG